MTVLVLPIIWERATRRLEPQPTVELARLPVARELIDLGDGGDFVVQMVRHTPRDFGGIAAHVYLVKAEGSGPRLATQEDGYDA